MKRDPKEMLLLFRTFVLNNATQWKLGSSHHHPIWQMVAETLDDINDKEPKSGEDWLLVMGAD